MATIELPVIKIKNLSDKTLVTGSDEIIIQSSTDTEKTSINKFITDIGLLKRSEVTGITALRHRDSLGGYCTASFG